MSSGKFRLPPSGVTKGFQLAAAVNILGILLFSKGLDNAYLAELSPEVFSTFGQGAIILWGLAYLAVAESYREAGWIVAVFCLEKLVYAGTWIVWMADHGSQLSTIFETSPLTGAFLAIYGPTDFLFAVFFGWVFLRVRKET